MNCYEHTFIAKQDLPSSQTKTLVNKYEDIIKKNSGKVLKTEEWGLRNLSHIIKNNKNILHAGTEKKNGKIYSKGGRVLNIIGIGKNLSEARSNAYDSINEVEWKDMYYRNDIGLIENE